MAPEKQCLECRGVKRKGKVGIHCFGCDFTMFSYGDRHNFVRCKCGAVFADGGDEYGRFGWNEKVRHEFRYEDGAKCCDCPEKADFLSRESEQIPAHSHSVSVHIVEAIVFNPPDGPLREWRCYRIEYGHECSCPEGTIWLPPECDVEDAERALGGLLP